MRRVIKVVLFLAAVFSLSVSEAADGGEARPFERVDQRMVSSSVTAYGDPGRTVAYVYENVGDRVITAWEHRCIKATNEGRVAWSSTAIEGFRTAALDRPPRVRRERLVYPGDRIETEVGFADDEDGPFAAVTCGVVLAIFENGSFWGGPDIAEPFFARRRAMAMDAHRLVEAIERIERAGGTGRLDSERFGAYGEQLQRLLDKREDERLPLQELSALKKQAEGELAEMLKHLRPVDRRMIREDQR